MSVLRDDLLAIDGPTATVSDSVFEWHGGEDGFVSIRVGDALKKAEGSQDEKISEAQLKNIRSLYRECLISSEEMAVDEATTRPAATLPRYVRLRCQ